MLADLMKDLAIVRIPKFFFLVAALMALALALQLAPDKASAAGVPTRGDTWRSGSVVKVFSALPKRYDVSVKEAVKQYNRSGARIKLRQVKRRGGANILLKLANIPVPGLSTYGKPASGPSVVRIGRFWDRAARGDGLYFASYLVTHEIGHSLGLDHPPLKRRLCSVMESRFFSVCKRPEQEFGTWVCGLLRQVDKRALVKLYGGRPTKQGPWYCDVQKKEPGTGTIKGLFKWAEAEVVGGDDALAARIRWNPVPGLRMLIERRDVACAEATAKMPIKTMQGSGADNTVDASRGVATDPFPVEQPTTVCYWLTLIDRKTGAKSKTMQVEAQLESAEAEPEPEPPAS